MKKPLISIIIPIYQVEKYLHRCVDSVIDQTYSNLEIILVDDGSLDNCPKICDEYAKKDKRIKVIHKKNGGLSDARNKGLSIMKGEYVSFIDSDDYVEKDYIEYLYYLVKKYKTNFSCCASRAIYDSGTVITQETNEEFNLTQKEAFERILYQNNFTVASWGKLYKKELFNDIKFPKGKLHEDALTTYKLIDKCDNISLGLVCKYNYMIRGDSILTKKFSVEKLTLLDAYEEMGNCILEKYSDLENAVVRSKVYAHFSTLRQMVYAEKRLKDKEKEIRKYILKRKWIVLKDKLAPKRDKIAILTLLFGVGAFKFSWTIYCKLTGRIFM